MQADLLPGYTSCGRVTSAFSSSTLQLNLFTFAEVVSSLNTWSDVKFGDTGFTIYSWTLIGINQTTYGYLDSNGKRQCNHTGQLISFSQWNVWFSEPTNYKKAYKLKPQTNALRHKGNRFER